MNTNVSQVSMILTYCFRFDIDKRLGNASLGASKSPDCVGRGLNMGSQFMAFFNRPLP